MKLAKLQKTKSTIRFDAELFQPKSSGKTGSSTLLTLPKNASAKLPRSTTTVEGVINSYPFRATLELDGNESHLLKITKTMRDATGADVGDSVSLEIARVANEPETRVPIDLHKALEATPRAKVTWTDITPIARRDWIFWMISAKQLETRARRIEKACDMLSKGKRRVCCFGGINWLMKHPA